MIYDSGIHHDELRHYNKSRNGYVGYGYFDGIEPKYHWVTYDLTNSFAILLTEIDSNYSN